MYQQIMPRLVKPNKFSFLLLLSFVLLPNALAVAQNQQSSDTSSNMFAEILQYAKLANAAYANRKVIENTLNKQGYSLVRHASLPKLHVSYYLASNDKNKTHVIAVRGTSNVENALVDIAIQLINNDNSGMLIHNGFAVSAKAIYDDVKSNLHKDYTIKTTGHSLGGAVATVLAMNLGNGGFQVGRVITFGQPKVTNISGSRKLDELDIWRVVTLGDLVPLVPPLDIADINNLNIYWHSGREIILLDGKQYSISSGIESMLRATKFLAKPLSEKNLRDHQMSHYLDLINEKTSNAQWIPYKNDLSIFLPSW